jgi:hypothetical protein
MPKKKHAERDAEAAARREALREAIMEFMRYEEYAEVEDIAHAVDISPVEAGRLMAPLVRDGTLNKQVLYTTIKDTFYELADR